MNNQSGWRKRQIMEKTMDKSLFYPITHGDYQTFIEIHKSDEYTNKYMVSFQTKYADAKDPNALQTKFEMFLTEKELTDLASILNAFMHNKDII